MNTDSHKCRFPENYRYYSSDRTTCSVGGKKHTGCYSYHSTPLGRPTTREELCTRNGPHSSSHTGPDSSCRRSLPHIIRSYRTKFRGQYTVYKDKCSSRTPADSCCSTGKSNSPARTPMSDSAKPPVCVSRHRSRIALLKCMSSMETGRFRTCSPGLRRGLCACRSCLDTRAHTDCQTGTGSCCTRCSCFMRGPCSSCLEVYF